MSFLYPRTVTITRPAEQSGVGFQGYGADQQATETQIACGIAASIQARGANRSPVGLPADGRPASWRVFIPKWAALNLGDIKDRDIVTDDLGNRFQIIADYWNSLGFNLLCDRLEA